MGLFVLTTTNDRLSWVIHKHPEKVVARTVRSGAAVLWFETDRRLLIHFTDDPFKLSFRWKTQKDFDYLNIGQYCSSAMYLSLITTFFSSAMKEDHPAAREDVNGTHCLSFTLVEVNTMVAKLYRDHLHEHLEMSTDVPDERSAPRSPVSFTGTGTLQKILSLVSMFLFLNAVMNNEFIQLDGSNITKYIKLMEPFDLPYYFRSKLVEKLVRTDEKLFAMLRPSLERSEHGDVYKLQTGNSQQQRCRFIKNVLSPFRSSVLDVGCGAGYHALSFGPLVARSGHRYVAFDPDKAATQHLQEKIIPLCGEGDRANAVDIFNDFEQAIGYCRSLGRVDVVCTEVIEHMATNEAESLIRQVLESVNFDTFIITTPNKQFNEHYALAEGAFRHWDHKWEMSKDELRAFVEDIFATYPHFKWTVENVGNSVNDNSVSLAVVIRRGNEDCIPLNFE